MHPLESCCVRLRHHPWIKGADWLWNKIRPCYEWALGLVAPNGLERVINGTDAVRLHRKFRSVMEVYEPLVWERLMAEIQKGDIVADVGAHIGLYTVAFAKRVGSMGEIVAFEPNPQTFEELKYHVKLNGVGQRVKFIPAAVGDRKGRVLFEAGRGSESHVIAGTGIRVLPVEVVTLDETFSQGRLDILKIDVEGYEEKVLEGGSNLLKDPSRCPRAIYVEVHPYAWPVIGTSSGSLLKLLNHCRYRVLSVDGQPIERIESWGEIIARKQED